MTTLQKGTPVFKKKTEATALDKAIDTALFELSSLRIETPEYATAADQLSKLYKLQEISSPKRISPDTLALIGANLAGIILILSYEQTHVVASKALNFVSKTR